jgi:hypothetical protein
MNATFQFAGDTYSVYTNDKIYRRGAYALQYVEVRHGFHKTEARWDHNCQNWNKRCGSPEYDEAVAKACGFIKEPVVEAPKARKPRAQKVSPVVAQLRLPEGKKAEKVRCENRIHIVEVAPKVEQKEVEMEEKMQPRLQYTMKGQVYEMPENGISITGQDEVRRLEWLSVNSKNQALRENANLVLSQYRIKVQRQDEALTLDRDEVRSNIKTALRMYRENNCKHTRSLQARVEEVLKGKMYGPESYVMALRIASHPKASYDNIKNSRLDEAAFNSFVREGRECDWFGQARSKDWRNN